MADDGADERAAEAERSEVVDLCRDLIRIDTTNAGDDSGPGERKAAEYVAGLLEEVGIETRIYESDPGRASVLAQWGGQDARGDQGERQREEEPERLDQVGRARSVHERGVAQGHVDRVEAVGDVARHPDQPDERDRRGQPGRGTEPRGDPEHDEAVADRPEDVQDLSLIHI